MSALAGYKLPGKNYSEKPNEALPRRIYIHTTYFLAAFKTTAKMTSKTILSGRLEFGSQRSFEQVVKMFQHRVENFFKQEIFLLPAEEFFREEEYVLDIPRLVTQSTEKTWRNTMSLLEYVAQYAIAGSIHAWMTEDGAVLEQRLIEPRGDKVAVQSFLHGRELIKEEGMETEAMKSLNQAIEKYARHALAYERRGYVNYLLRNFADAIYDFSKSIDINPHNADPYLGRAMVRIAQGQFRDAIQDLDNTIKNSIPLQPIYWKARRIKGECHLKLEEFDAAVFEYKLVTKREFTPDNPNYKHRKRALLDYGRSLIGGGKYAEAVQVLNASLRLEGEGDERLTTEPLLFRGIALQKAGQKGFENDWKEAANRGSRRAAELLEAI